ncbi:MAG: glycosyltransferase family 2 protein, partial [Aquaticitalea sp.]
RNNRIDAKAGNINNALKQASGEICLILDPDHVPNVDFIEEVIPYFDDLSIGFVQTVQTYYNINESAVAMAAAEQTFHFYGPVMMCMNTYGTVNAIGANCVFRRSALDSIGGHAAGLSEDMHTAMQLHAKGWKSIYVPEVFSAGLAPSTLTSYFKQQLKWSRGTLELLVTSFPKLFPNLTFRQKLHYGILPFHYFTGLIYMISILIPVVSLMTSSTPWNGNVLNFGLITMPVVASIIGIRFYVQKWVINRGERGLHLLGGLLMQITWSVYLMGLFYTIIRKKVPYIPTVKEDDRKTSPLIVLPNLLVGFICLFSIVYGLNRDFTPFSIFMAGFALWNAMIMFNTLHFAYQNTSPIDADIQFNLNKFNTVSLIENTIFSFWQKSAFIILTLTLIVCSYANYKKQDIKSEGMAIVDSRQQPLKYVGVFAPKVDNGMSDSYKVKEFSQLTNQKMDIVSFYLPWDKSVQTSFPEKELKNVYLNHAFPMITWEPWLNTFQKEEGLEGHVFDLIASGYFDEFIKQFATRIKSLERPVFLRFAHEFDNPFYPWYDSRDSAADDFKTAWIHTWNLFKQEGATNVIWVYNPWKAEHVRDFFPGDMYVDWISANILNYAKQDQPEKYYDFKTLYGSFHTEINKLGDYPVMISEFGTYNDGQSQKAWLEDAIKVMNQEFPEIQAVIYFNSNVDNNMPNGKEAFYYLDWTIAHTDSIELKFKSGTLPTYLFERNSMLFPNEGRTFNKLEKLEDLKGVNFKNGQDWNRDYHVLTRKNLVSNFTKIKKLGLNTIKYTSNQTYDYNVTNISKEFDLNLSFGFWIPEQTDFITDSIQASILKDDIINVVKKYKDHTNIVNWNLQNDLFSIYHSQFNEPLLSYHINAYMSWLQKLTSEMKLLDPNRPIVIDLNLSRKETIFAKKLMETVNGVDAIGLIIKNGNNSSGSLEAFQNAKIPYVYNDISIDMMDTLKVLPTHKAFYISNWQDQYRLDKLTFDGMVDRKGRYKMDYFTLGNKIKKFSKIPVEKPIKILKTLTLLNSEIQADYYALIYDSKKGWRQIELEDHLKVEWGLVKCDKYGNFLTIKDVGNKPNLLMDIPDNYKSYLLRLSVIKGNKVTSTMTTLNTPYHK